jgi:alpha-N-acetylglucosamine transferase
MITSSVKNEYRDLLQSVGWQTKVVPSLSNPNVTNERFKDTYTKLNAWRLTKYHRVLLLDADIVVKKSFTELFDVSLSRNGVAGKKCFNYITTTSIYCVFLCVCVCVKKYI